MQKGSLQANKKDKRKRDMQADKCTQVDIACRQTLHEVHTACTLHASRIHMQRGTDIQVDTPCKLTCKGHARQAEAPKQTGIKKPMQADMHAKGPLKAHVLCWQKLAS